MRGLLGRTAAAAVALATALVARQAQGQVNIERLRRTEADSGFAGTVGANLTARTGNVRLVLVNVDGRLDYGGAKWLAFVVGNTDVGWQGGERFSNSGLLHVRGNLRLSPVVAGEVFTQVDYDKSRLLAFRSIAGAGARFNLARSERWRFSTGTGLMFEHEQLELPATAIHPSETNGLRWTTYVTGRFRDGERLSLAGTVYAQPRLDDFADVRVLSDVRLAVQLVGALSLTVASRVRYDSRPPDGIQELDTALTTGLALEW